MSVIAEQAGDSLGHFLLHEQIGEGGFGVVFRAEQRAPVRRMVALKVIKPGMDSKEVIARFEAERQALALMDHPYIAKVYDAGTTDYGRPYFVMELVEGKPLATYCDERRLDIRQRLSLFAEICDAVQHAHQKGVIHRDLKPSNILVCDGEERQPLPKIIDFGVAKAISIELTEKTFFTIFGGLVGTPQYMSPEQAALNAVDVDTRSDIYSLGVALYELITGGAPLDKEELTAIDFDEMRRMVREKEPPIPSVRISSLSAERLQRIAHARGTEPAKIRRQITGDLDWIMMKALDKDPDRRYPTAQSFALDLRRYLGDLPVLAGPPGAAYRVGKFVRRNRGAAAVTALGVTALIVVVIGVMLASSRLREAITEAEFEHLQMLLEKVQNSQDGDPGSKASGLMDLRQIGEETNPGQIKTKVEGIDPLLVDQLRNDARDQLIDSLAWTDLTEKKLFGHSKKMVGAAFDTGQSRFVIGLEGGQVEVHDSGSGVLLAASGPLGEEVAGPLCFAAGGDIIAVGHGS
ncbi:MAG: serine/threonine-protein kinase, partial [Verrucomicrobiales bacterium]|nr:serine/threonine-protein kinase [Verrucomicrobiales bacterium]